MQVEIALRRIAARAIAAPGFDPGGIPAAQELIEELGPLIEQVRAEAPASVPPLRQSVAFELLDALSRAETSAAGQPDENRQLQNQHPGASAAP